MAESIYMPFGMGLDGWAQEIMNNVLDGAQIPRWEGQFRENKCSL